MLKIKQLMKPEERKWDEDLVTNVFNSKDRDSILNIPQSQSY